MERGPPDPPADSVPCFLPPKQQSPAVFCYSTKLDTDQTNGHNLNTTLRQGKSQRSCPSHQQSHSDVSALTTTGNSERNDQPFKAQWSRDVPPVYFTVQH